MKYWLPDNGEQVQIVIHDSENKLMSTTVAQVIAEKATSKPGYKMRNRQRQGLSLSCGNALGNVGSSRFQEKDRCEKRAPEIFPELSASASLSIEENAHKRMPSEARETHTHKMGGRNPQTHGVLLISATERRTKYFTGHPSTGTWFCLFN